MKNLTTTCELKKIDQYNEIGIAITDIIRAKKHLWAMGEKEGNSEFLTEAGRINLVSELIDLDINELTAINTRLEAQINSLIFIKKVHAS